MCWAINSNSSKQNKALTTQTHNLVFNLQTCSLNPSSNNHSGTEPPNLWWSQWAGCWRLWRSCRWWTTSASPGDTHTQFIHLLSTHRRLKPASQCLSDVLRSVCKHSAHQGLAWREGIASILDMPVEADSERCCLCPNKNQKIWSHHCS